MELCAPGPSSARGSCQTLSDGVSPNTEGGQTADGRWNRPTNFGPLIGDLLDVSTSKLPSGRIRPREMARESHPRVTSEGRQAP